MEKKLFRLNEDGLAGWFVARNKREALQEARRVWGVDYVLEIFKQHIEDCPEDSINDFIEYFVQEENAENDFTLYDEFIGETTTKTVQEFLDEIDDKDVPMWFAGEDY